MEKCFYRKVGYGLSITDKVPSDPLQWAQSQVASVPTLHWTGKTYSTKDGIEFARKLRKVQDKADKTKDRKKREAIEKKGKLENGRWFHGANEITIRHNEAINGDNPVFERFSQFWCNHFSIVDKSMLPWFVTGPYHREVIRPALGGNFNDLLYDATISWAMIENLDNDENSGPNSKKAHENYKAGINENHARELMELHSISPNAGYTQEDVIQAAYIMSGWRHKWTEGRKKFNPVKFEGYSHQPGKKTVMGKTYEGGKKELRAFTNDLSNHTACKKFIATKLCRHFVTENPTDEMIQPIITAWTKSNGSLPFIHKAVIKVTYEYSGKEKKFSQVETWMEQLARMYKFRWIPQPKQMIWNPKYKSFGLQRRILKWLEKTGQHPYKPRDVNGWSDFKTDWISGEQLIRRLIFAKQVQSWGMKNQKEFHLQILEKNFEQKNIDTILARVEFDGDGKLGSENFALLANSPEVLYV